MPQPQSNASQTYEWAIIGAGPAGIATVGTLIDHGVAPEQIIWIDPEFKVGDFGTKWRNVSSNTRVGLFTRFLEHCKSFQYKSEESPFEIHQLDPTKTCLLHQAADPLQSITEHLKGRIQTWVGKVVKLHLSKRRWTLSLANDSQIYAKSVVVATGAEPTSLAFPGVKEISLTEALNPELLKKVCGPEDTVAVFGSSHSAVIIIQTLLEKCHVKKVINFYKDPLRYAVYLEDWILFDDTGLKGNTAVWARENIDGEWPKGLERYLSNEENVRVHLPLCDKAVYATGFQKRLIPVDGMETLNYNDRSGIIAPGLFGVGIAFPEAKIDRFGTLEYRVGLWKFMEYLHRVVPLWLKYGT